MMNAMSVLAQTVLTARVASFKVDARSCRLQPTWTGCWGGKFHYVASRFALINQGASRNLRPGTYWTVANAKINRTDITKRQLEGAGAEDKR